MTRSTLSPASTGPWALVVGGSTTIGAEFAMQLAARGFKLVLVARGTARLDSLARRIHDRHGVEARTLALDLLEEGATHRLLDATDGLDVGVLIMNANLHRVNEFHRMSEREKRAMSRLNYEIPVELTHHYGGAMVARRRGGIVFVNTLNSLTALEIDAVFQGTKAGLRIFAESLSLEYERAGVRVASAHVSGIEGSESYQAKLPSGTRRMLRWLGTTLPPERIVAQCLEQFDAGRLILCPDGAFPLNRMAMTALDVLRIGGFPKQRALLSRVFGAMLQGEEVRDGLRGEGYSRSAAPDESTPAD